MVEVKKVGIENFINNIEDYYNSNVTINECPFFVCSSIVYADYYLQIGSRGDITVVYDNNRKTNVSFYDFKDHQPNYGVGRPAINSYANVGAFPMGGHISKTITNCIQETLDTVNKYHHFYTSAKTRLDTIKKNLKDHPEYLI